jgi:membrane peptidoglycan carboxypeptidase
VRKTDLTLLIKKRHEHHTRSSNRAVAISRRFTIGVLSILMILLSGGLLIAGLFYARVTADLPSLDVLPVLLNPVDGELLEPTVITDRSGETVLYTLDNPGVKRAYLAVNPEKPDHFNPQLIRAVIAKLDPTFWENPGYSLKDWRNPEPATIAERLASEMLLWQEPPSAMRAVRMRLLAAQLVADYGRTQVLEWYLNSAWFGHLATGAESASLLYFNKSAQDLGLAESAMLAVVNEAPALNPLDAPDQAYAMQQQLLGEMAQLQTISLDEFASALREQLALRTSISDPASMAPAFTRRLLASLESQFSQKRLQRGGLVIQSTLDWNLQTQFACTAKTQLLRLQGILEAPSRDCPTALLLPTQNFAGLDAKSLASAGVILNPANGEVLAYLEPTTYDGSYQTDGGYQPGSLLSPFAALAGFARGLSPASLQWDTPAELADTYSEYQNPDKLWHGAVSLREALANDYLLPITDVLRQAGAVNAWHLTAAMGISSMNDVGETIDPLFSGSTNSLLDVAAAYGTLANSGLKSGLKDAASDEINPALVQTISSTTRRILLDQSIPQTSVILSPPLAYLVNNVLSDESARWPTLGYPNALEIGQPAAAKLGTTLNHNQVWSVGYTPDRLVLVWLGDTSNASQQRLEPLIAAGIWHAVIKSTLQTAPSAGWQQPEGVTSLRVCIPSGMLPSMDCPATSDEVFLIGNEPTLPDSLYEKIKVNRETGQRATVFTDPALIEEQLFINVPLKARSWAIEAGLAVAPTGYDAIPVAQANPNVQISSPAIFSAVSGKVSIMGTASMDDLASWTLQVGEGINPLNWLQIASGSSAVTSGSSLAEWDTADLDGLFAIRLTVIDQSQHVQSTTLQVTVDNTPPQVKITYPAADQEIEPAQASVTLQANIEDNTGIKQVEWFVDGKLAATQTDGPWLYLMPAVRGKHTLMLTVEDKAGNKTSTEKLEFSIK